MKSRRRTFASDPDAVTVFHQLIRSESMAWGKLRFFMNHHRSLGAAWGRGDEIASPDFRVRSRCRHGISPIDLAAGSWRMARPNAGQILWSRSRKLEVSRDN